jgi:hypothetical protein
MRAILNLAALALVWISFEGAFAGPPDGPAAGRPNADGPHFQRRFWEGRIANVKLGMTRAEVEKLLPPYQSPPFPHPDALYGGQTTLGTGGCQVNSYYVSPGWEVSVCYDYAGIPRDDQGRAKGHETRFPENRVNGPVRLHWRPLRAPGPNGPRSAAPLPEFGV